MSTSTPTDKRVELLKAARDGLVEDVQRLIDEPVSLQVVDEAGNTPLHWAVKQRQVQVVKLLLENGAYLDAVNKKGLRPIDMTSHTFEQAERRKILEIFDLFKCPPVLFQPHELDNDRQKLCNYFLGRVAQYCGNVGEGVNFSVFDLIYGDALQRRPRIRDPLMPTAEGIRWVHLPANNVCPLPVGVDRPLQFYEC